MLHVAHTGIIINVLVHSGQNQMEDQELRAEFTLWDSQPIDA